MKSATAPAALGVPREQPEMAAWRKLVEYRDQLCRQVASECESVDSAAGVARAQWGADAKYEHELRTAMEKSLRIAAAAAREKLVTLDSAIRSRPVKTVAPYDLADAVRVPALRNAVSAVNAYLAEGLSKSRTARKPLTAGFRAWLSLCGIAGRQLSNKEFDALIKEARAWRSEPGTRRSGTGVARFVVARVAGIPSGSRLLR